MICVDAPLDARSLRASTRVVDVGARSPRGRGYQRHARQARAI